MMKEDLSIASLSIANHNSEERKLFIKNNTKCSITIAKEFVKSSAKIIKSNNSLYIYKKEDGVYALFDKLLFEYYILAFIEEFDILEFWNRNKLKEVYKYLKVAPFEEVKLDENSNHLCLKNGILNIDTNELIEHSDKYYFTSKIDISYDQKDNDNKDFLDYLETTFNGDKKLIESIQYLGGYLLCPTNKANRIFLFDGAGASGKSTLINIYKLLFPKKFITAMSLEDMSKNTFNRSPLIYSRVNLSSEEKKSYIEAEEIKKIVSGEQIQINRKFLEELTIIPKTKIILACNGLPKFKDTSDGMARRMIVFPFPNTYKNEDDFKDIENPKKKNIYKKDRSIFKKIEKNKSSLLNIFLSHYKILRDNNFVFIEPQKSKEAKAEYRQALDPIREFIEENYIVSETQNIDLTSLYNEYSEWYRDNVGVYLKLRSQEFGKRVREIMCITGKLQRGNPFMFDGKRPIIYPIKKI